MLTLPSEILLLIYEHLKRDAKSLRMLTATCLQLRLGRIELARTDAKKMGQLNFIMEVDRMRRRQMAMRKVMRRNLESYGQQGQQLTRLKKEALGLKKPQGGLDTASVQRMLVMALSFTRGVLKRLAKQVRAEIQASNALYGDIGAYLKAFKDHLDADSDEKLRAAVERAYSAESSKTVLAKQFGDLERCLIRPYNDCVDACIALQLTGVPKKLSGW